MSTDGWLTTVYNEYRRPLFVAAWNILGCTSLAEDAIHAAFARMVRRAEMPDDPKTFAFRCVRNAAIDLLKTRARRREESIEGAVYHCFESEQSANESLEHVNYALSVLEPIQRELIMLHLQSNLTFREIAEVFQEPLQTVASRYRRAIERLRNQLEVYRD